MATKKSPIKKKAVIPQQPIAQPQQDQEQQEFFIWLDQQLGTNGDKNQLKQKLQEMGEEGRKQAYTMFQQEKEKAQTQQFRVGGMINHLVKLQQFRKGGDTTQYQRRGPTPMANDATFVYRANKPNLRGPQVSTPNYSQNINIMKAVPNLALEKLTLDMPFSVWNSIARLGEKIGLTPNKELWPIAPDGSKLSPAQYQKSLLTNMQDKRWNAIKEDRYLGQPRVSWRYGDGGLLTFKKGGITVTPCKDCDESKMPVKKLKMKGVSIGTAEIATVPTKNMDVKPKVLIKKKK